MKTDSYFLSGALGGSQIPERCQEQAGEVRVLSNIEGKGVFSAPPAPRKFWKKFPKHVEVYKTRHGVEVCYFSGSAGLEG